MAALQAQSWGAAVSNDHSPKSHCDHHPSGATGASSHAARRERQPTAAMNTSGAIHPSAVVAVRTVSAFAAASASVHSAVPPHQYLGL